MRRAVAALVSVGAVLIAAPGDRAAAHDGATGVVKTRMDGMKTMSDAAKALGAIKAGAIPYTPRTIRRAAEMLRREAMAAQHLFPEGSGGGVSEALPAIWSDRAVFDRILSDLVDAAARMDAAAETEADAMAAAADAAATCKACHADYRKKKF